MKLTFDWLNDYCRTGLPVATTAEHLTRAGVKVEAIEEKGGETMIELEITANRPDCLSVLGVAREAGVLTGKPLTEPALKENSTRAHRSPDWMLDVKDDALCPRYVGRIIKGITVGPSPMQMRRRLEAVGLRSVNNVVDITNYVMLECGQPLHAFDLSRLSGKSILVRKGNAGEKMKAIDGREYDVAGALVIADAERAVAIAGVMGGKDTEVTGATTEILLESAVFDPVTVRRTCMRTGLGSDSSYRFQRGVDPARVDWASRRAVELLVELAGAKPEGIHLDTNPKPVPKRQMVMRERTIEKVLGRKVETPMTRRILEGLGFEIREELDGEWRIAIPTWRADVTREVDLVEEVARIYGYDRIPATPRVMVALSRATPFDACARIARETLCGAGYDEALTLSFTGKHAAEAPFLAGEAVGVLGKTGKVEEFLRTGLVPSLLDAFRTHEAYGEKTAHLFEIAKAYARMPRGFEERSLLAAVTSGSFMDLKGVIENLLDRLGLLAGFTCVPAARAWLVPGRTGAVLLQGREVGVLGEVASGLASAHDLRGRVHAAELDFDALIEASRLARRFSDFPTLPAIHRDIAVVLDRAVAWKDVELAVRESAPAGLLESVRFFDLYEGKGIPAGKKSLAFSITLRDPSRTLTSEEADAGVKGIVEALGKKFGAVQR